MYELCRLGIHRPALRIAPDHGFVRVPLVSSAGSSNTSGNQAADAASSAIPQQTQTQPSVDPWFTRLADTAPNKRARQLGKYLKIYAQCLKALGLRIAAGHASTISSTAQAAFFPHTLAASSATSSSASSTNNATSSQTPVSSAKKYSL